MEVSIDDLISLAKELVITKEIEDAMMARLAEANKGFEESASTKAVTSAWLDSIYTL